MSHNKLCLGTVQFGLDYGINNSSGKPSKKEVFAMLDTAIEQGINYFDTAAAYGIAEELLGEYGIKKKNVKVISKSRPNLTSNKCTNYAKTMQDQIEQSLLRLKLDCLDAYLLHTPTDFYNQGIMEGLEICKSRGLIKHFGVSVYEVQHALDVVKSGQVDYIQIPYNVFDRRVDYTDFFQFAKKNQVTVFARSAFLQGLILMDNDKIPEHLAEVKDYLNLFDSIISKYGFNRVEAALLFSYTHPDINYLVFGVDNIRQLEEYINISQDHCDFSECRSELNSHFANISKNIISPNLWAK